MGSVGRKIAGGELTRVAGELTGREAVAKGDAAAADLVGGLGRDHFPGKARAAAAPAPERSAIARLWAGIGSFFEGLGRANNRRARTAASEGPFRPARRVSSPEVRGAARAPVPSPLAEAPAARAPFPKAPPLSASAPEIVATVGGKPYTRQDLIELAVEKEPGLRHPFGDGPEALSNDALLDIIGLKPPAPPAPVQVVPPADTRYQMTAEDWAKHDEWARSHPMN